MKIDKQVVSCIASDFQTLSQGPRLPWLGPLELSRVAAETVSQRIRRMILTNLTLEFPFAFCSGDGFVVLMVCSGCHKKIPYRSVSGESPLPGLQRTISWVSSHAWQRGKEVSLFFFLEGQHSYWFKAPTLKTTFNFNHLLKALLHLQSLQSPPGGLGTQHMNFEGDTIQLIGNGVSNFPGKQLWKEASRQVS